MGYEEREISRVLDAGPHDDETWFRLQIRGRLATRWLNATPAQVRRIAAVLADSKGGE